MNRISPSIGFDVPDVSFSTNSHPSTQELIELLNQHKLLIFRDQDLDVDGLEYVASLFGSTLEYPLAVSIKPDSAVIEIVNEENAAEKFSSTWHVDSSFLDETPDITLLYAVEVPEVGGDTVLSNTEAAYEALSEPLRSMLGKLEIENSSDLDPHLNRDQHMTPSLQIDTGRFTSIHPLIVEHPVTHKSAIAANMEHSFAIRGLSKRESRFLLALLFEHIAQHEFTCRIRWRRGTLAVWDNRCTQHRALNDYTAKRIMHRVLVRR